MSEKILITGSSGFIGRNVLRQLLQKKYEITALIRPRTTAARIAEFTANVKFVEIDLADIAKLKAFLETNVFDIIIHIGAIRGGRNCSKTNFFNTNVNATEQLVLNAQHYNSAFIFCSSVGVFGAIPLELPANNSTKRQPDNYYHFTKIRAESIIQKHVLYGLKAAIIRPAITYGIGDFGFPHTLIKLIDKKLLYLPDTDVRIHLTDVDLLSQAFLKLTESDFTPGVAYNVADKEPVELHELANFISKELRGQPYPGKKNIDKKYFRRGEKISRFFHNELWTARFELISKSWYYDTIEAYNDLLLKSIETIPNFKAVTDWYKQSKIKK
ncbi:MAG: NAD(P)-dependent oxidoreductase [Candidatus Cloacimonetes bacterium]|nr:NAD(P)-dependent oxidoreductase [Candidatus Cloacimonadota bacterium]MBL7149756.1 NAD(P)-dependent oxidoreductase [Candidatus Cloacimonadota bacterium]